MRGGFPLLNTLVCFYLEAAVRFLCSPRFEVFVSDKMQPGRRIGPNVLVYPDQMLTATTSFNPINENRCCSVLINASKIGPLEANFSRDTSKY